MTVLVDTCVWSLVLRRKDNQQNNGLIEQLNRLIQQRQIVMLGVIRQEILSGIQLNEQFERIRSKLKIGLFKFTISFFKFKIGFFWLASSS